VLSFKKDTNEGGYESFYYERLNQFKSAQSTLVACIEISNLQSETDLRKIKEQLQQARNGLKSVDFWWRYLEPIQYKKINGPLPVEWETEVFEKFEAPYKREGAGLTLAALYLDEGDVVKDSLLRLLNTSVQATETYLADSITKELNSYHHFFLCNRLYLLNLAAIYTTGFECPDTAQVIPELRLMLQNVDRLYEAYNQSFPKTALPENYLNLHKDAIHFVGQQPSTYSAFDHFDFIKTYINPLFLLNQKMIRAIPCGFQKSCRLFT
jgi:cytochrome c peroxidase